MKKIIAVVWTLSLLLGLITTALAVESTTYDLEELGVTIDIPNDYIVFTRDTPEDDPNYAAYGLTKESMDELFDQRSIYLNAWDADIQFEIVVTMAESSFADFSTQSDTVLTALSSSLDDVYEDLGYAFLKADIYPHRQTKFMKIYAQEKQSNNPVYTLQYNTTCNAQSINITLRSFSGEITEEKEDILRNIVDTVNFQNVEPPSPDWEETESFEYKDPKTGISFSVPANWVEKPLSGDREFIDAKFSPTQEDGLLILYGSIDYWTKLREDAKLELTRASINNSLLTEEHVAPFVDDPRAENVQISKVTYAQKEYFQIKATTHVKTEVFNLSFPIVYLIRLENGYLFYFQFLGADSGPYFEDFISLINSVQYPFVDDTSADSVLSPTAQMTSGVSTAMTAAGVIAIILAVLFFVWVFRHKSSGSATTEQSVSISPGSASADPTEDLPMTQQIDATEAPDQPEPGPAQEEGPAVLVCRCCGAALPFDSIFCHKCGTKVEKTGDEPN